MGPECNQKCHYEREAERDLIEVEKKKKKAMCGWKQEGALTAPEEKKAVCWKKREAEAEREDAALKALNLEGGVHEPRNTRNAAVDAGKGKNVDSLREPPEGAERGQPLAFSPVILISNFWPTEL